MGRIKTLGLTPQQHEALDQGLRNGKTHAFRKRCQLVLLKEQGRTSVEVGSIVGMCEMTVNNWLSRYEEEGLDGLLTKPGRGRRAKLDKLKDAQPVLSAVKTNRQRLLTAKAEFEAEGGTKVSRDTLRRFLKSLADDTNA
jgi:transposase